MRVGWSSRFWAVYSACWLPVVAFYTLTFLAQPRQPATTVPDALTDSLENVLPQYLMGLFVWWYSARVPWPRERLVRFLVAHAALASAFAALWTWMVYLALKSIASPYVDMRNVLPWQWLIGMTSYWVVAGLMYTVRGAARTRELELAAEQSERLRAQAELAALRAHINPHFLFNALHAVGQLQREDPSRAEEAIERVSALFRYILRLDRHEVDVVSLEEEWEFTQDYLWLERSRMGDRLVVDARLSAAALEADVPPFTLQPLVENAVRHGLAPSPTGGTLRITAEELEGELHLRVADDGVGAASAMPLGNGVGLRAVRQRLEARHGPALQMSVVSAPGHGYAVSLRFPSEGT